MVRRYIYFGFIEGVVMSVSVQIDYYNLQFLVFEDGKLIMDILLLVEVQQVVIKKVIYDVVNEIRMQFNVDVFDYLLGLKEWMIY